MRLRLCALVIVASWAGSYAAEVFSDVLTEPGSNGASTAFYSNMTSWRARAVLETRYDANAATVYSRESWTSAATGMLYVDGTDAAFVTEDGNFNLTSYLSSFPAHSSISALVLNPWGAFLGLDERNQFELLRTQFGSNLQSQANALAGQGVQLLLAVALDDNATTPLVELILEDEAISTQIELGLNGTWAGDDAPGWLPQSWTGDEFSSTTRQLVRFDPNKPLVLSVRAPALAAAPFAPLSWTPFSRLLPAALAGDTWPASAWQALELRHSPVVDACVLRNRTAALLQAFVAGGAPAIAQMVAGWSSAITPRESELLRRTALLRSYIHPLVAPVPSPSLPPFVSPTPRSTPTSTATALASPSSAATGTTTALASPSSAATGTATAQASPSAAASGTPTAAVTAAATTSGTPTATGSLVPTPSATPHPTDTPTQSATPPQRLRRLGGRRRSAALQAHAHRRSAEELTGPRATQAQASGLFFRQLSSVPYFPVPATNSHGELQPGAVTASLHVATCTDAFIGNMPRQSDMRRAVHDAGGAVCAVWLLGNAAPVAVNATVDVAVLQQYLGGAGAGGAWNAFDLYHGNGLFAPAGVVNVPMGPLDAAAVLAIPAAAPRSGFLDGFLAQMRTVTRTPLADFSGQWAPTRQTYYPPVPARPALAPPKGMRFVPGGVAFPFTVQAVLPPVLSSAFPAAAAAWGGHAPPGYGVQFSWESEPTAVHAPYSVWPRPMYADVVPATNGQWRRFLLETGFAPADSRSYLAHWRWDGCVDSNVSKCMPPRMKRQPVVFVAPSDAAAYCAWRGGRLPTDWEWAFLAAAAPAGPASAEAWDIRQYPWGDTPCNSTTCPPPLTSARGLPPGTHAYDKLPDVGSFPAGASPWGLMDMAALVRQWVGGVYCDVQGGGAGAAGHTCRALSRGGSAWQPQCSSASCYYATGGTSNGEHMVHPFAAEFQLRNGFTGLRCVADTPAAAHGGE